MFEIAASDQDAIDRVRARLQNDVGFLLAAINGSGQAPFWAVCRMTFPIWESLAYLLYGDNPSGTSRRLSKFLRDVLGQKNASYQPIASVICQVWRHGLTHGDEPPFLIADAVSDGKGGYDFSNARSMSWKLTFGPEVDHLKIERYGTQSAQFTFCLVTYYKDLLATTNDPTLWSAVAAGEVQRRYNSWCAKFLDPANWTSEEKQAATEIKALLP